jgi:hypothetical protein
MATISPRALQGEAHAFQGAGVWKSPVDEEHLADVVYLEQGQRIVHGARSWLHGIDAHCEIASTGSMRDAARGGPQRCGDAGRSRKQQGHVVLTESGIDGQPPPALACAGQQGAESPAEEAADQRPDDADRRFLAA